VPPPSSFDLRRIVRLALWWLAWLLAGSAITVAAQAQTVVLREALVTSAPGERFPDNATAHVVHLPEVWDHQPPETGPLWYRLRFKLASAPSGVLVAYIERLCSDFDLRLNGQLLQQASSLTAPRSHPCHQPVMVSLPPALLVVGENQIDIRLAGLALQRVSTRERAATLGPITLGPAHELAARLAVQRTLGIELTVAFTAAAALVGLAALAMARTTRIAYLAYFGAATLGWALLVTLMCGLELPLPALWGEALLSAIIPPVAVGGMVFLLRYCGLAMGWVEISLWSQCLIVPLSLVIAWPDRLHTVAQPWPMILLLELGVTMGVFLRRAWQLSRPDFQIMVVVLGVFATGLTAELVAAEGRLALPGKHGLNLALLALFGGMCWRLYERYQADLQAAHDARTLADKRAQEALADMERNYGQMAELRVEQVAAKERKRIAADLHDDLGAKLLTIVHTSDNERIATLGREALEEMRLSVRGLTGKAVQVGDAVGDWRSEAMSRLSQGGIELVWNVNDEVLFSERKMSARAYVQTTRILREAISNLLKHSQATHCEISVKSDANDFDLTIVDNGRGIPMELDGKLDRGHGMMTMKSRAKQLQGQCLVESGPGFGTTIRLTLPL
jgi:signal transduction histidine kinase